MTYDIHKSEIINDKPFDDMEPRFIVTKDSHYYLITSGGRHNSISHFRIDRIRNIEIYDNSLVSEFRYQDAYEYALKSIFMFSGKPEFVHLRVRKGKRNAFDLLLDEFGLSVKSNDYNDEWFDVFAECSPQGVLILAQKYLDLFFIISPKSLQGELIRRMETNLSWARANKG